MNYLDFTQALIAIRNYWDYQNKLMQLGITVEEDPGSKMEKILIKMLAKATNDKRGSIELFVYETDFGKIGKEYTGNFNEDTFKLWNSLKE